MLGELKNTNEICFMTSDFLTCLPDCFIFDEMLENEKAFPSKQSVHPFFLSFSFTTQFSTIQFFWMKIQQRCTTLLCSFPETVFSTLQKSSHDILLNTA